MPKIGSHFIKCLKSSGILQNAWIMKLSVTYIYIIYVYCLKFFNLFVWALKKQTEKLAFVKLFSPVSQWLQIVLAGKIRILCLPAMLLKAEDTTVSSVVSVLSFWATLNPSITTRIPIASIQSYLIFAGNTCFTEINNENIMDHCSFFCPFYINHCVVSPSSCS